MEKLRNVLVTDRTAADAAARNEKGTYGAEDLNRVLRACSWLAGLLEERGYSVSGEFFPAALASASAQPPNGGTVRGALGYLGETVTVKAQNEENFRFVGWFENGSLVCREPEYSFAAARDRDLTAIFRDLGTEAKDVVGEARVGTARAR